jgi:hypothetical protein
MNPQTRATAERVLNSRLSQFLAAAGIDGSAASPNPVWDDAIGWGLAAAGFDPEDPVSPTDSDVGRLASVTDWFRFLDWAEVRALETAGSGFQVLGTSVTYPNYSVSNDHSGATTLYQAKFDKAVKQWGYPKNWQGGLTTGTILCRPPRFQGVEF